MVKWIISRRQCRKYTKPGSLLMLLLIVIILYQQIRRNRTWSSSFSRQRDDQLWQQAQYWKSLQRLLANNDPQCKKRPDPVLPRNPDILYSPDQHPPRPDVLWMDNADLERMKTTHSNFVAGVHDAAVLFDAHSQGIVTTSTELALPDLTLSLRMLRQTNSTLPVEVFLPSSSQYTTNFCSQILSYLGARCHYLDDIFNTARLPIRLEPAQRQAFAILFSSFEDVFWLDSSCPISTPDSVFTSLQNQRSGLLLWSDLWFSAESPYFFHIANMSVPVNQRPATSSGAMVISKRKHGLALLLAVYYNFYGPEYYYPLQRQGSPGPQKETFFWAATVLGQEIWHLDGHRSGKDLSESDRAVRVLYDLVDYFPGEKSRNRSKPMFVHWESPFDALKLVNGRYAGYEVKEALSATQLALEEAGEVMKIDLNQRFWKALHDVVCEDLPKRGITGRFDDGIRSCLKIKEFERGTLV